MAKILVVDDQESYRVTLEEALGTEHELRLVDSGERAVEVGSSEPMDLVITDLRLGGITGLEVVRRLKRVDPYLEAIVMTAYGTIETAVEAMKEGAYDYITKPFNLDEFQLLVSNALERRELRATVSRLQKDLQQRYGFARIIGKSAAMQEISRALVKVAASDATALLCGESGTGKGLTARAIHHNSPRRERSFVEINCAGLPEPLLESELFGHARGAFTDAKVARKGLIEEADQGTFFLDEIGDASIAIQSKLLKVLEDGHLRRVGENAPRPVNVRFIAASNKNLRAEVAAGRFREDLYFRLNVVAIRLPPLRERTEDVPMLAHHFLGELAARAGKAIREIVPPAIDILRRYPWPGNIRELKNVLEHAIIMTDGDVIRENDLPAFLRSAPPSNGKAELGEVTLSELERRHIAQLLEKKSDLGTVAKILGIGRTTLWRKMKEYGFRK